MSSPDTDLSPQRDATTVSIAHAAGVDVVSVTGDFDVRSESSVRRLTTDPTLLTQSQVILDLSGVGFMDARGLSTIAYCRRTLAERSVNLALVCPEGQALHVLGLLGFERIVSIYPDRETALFELSDSRNRLRARRSGSTG